MSPADKPSHNDSGQAPDHWTRREFKGIPASMGALWTTRGDDGGWRYGLQVDNSHCNAQGFIHGGVLMSFMDHAMALLIWEAVDRAMTSTIQMDCHFLSAVRAPAFIEHDYQILKQGRTLIFARGVLKVAGKDVFEGTGVWSIAAKS